MLKNSKSLEENKTKHTLVFFCVCACVRDLLMALFIYYYYFVNHAIMIWCVFFCCSSFPQHCLCLGPLLSGCVACRWMTSGCLVSFTVVVWVSLFDIRRWGRLIHQLHLRASSGGCDVTQRENLETIIYLLTLRDIWAVKVKMLIYIIQKEIIILTFTLI